MATVTSTSVLRRIDDRDPRVHVPAMDAGLGERAHAREVGAVVDAEQQRGVVDRMGGDAVEQLERRGQVELALGVVGGQAREGVPQGGAVEGVDAGVDLADGELLGRRVAWHLGLHHALHGPVLAAHDAPVARRVVELHRGDGRLRIGGRVSLDEVGERLGGDQRNVAVEDEHGRVAQVRGRGLHGAAGPVGLGLDRELHAVGQVALERPLRPVDDHDLARPGGQRRGHRPRDHGLPAEVVQDLGRARAHAGALAGGEDDDGRCDHRADARGRSAASSRPCGRSARCSTGGSR